MARTRSYRRSCIWPIEQHHSLREQMPQGSALDSGSAHGEVTVTVVLMMLVAVVVCTRQWFCTW
jgi:hypothetical protein